MSESIEELKRRLAEAEAAAAEVKEVEAELVPEDEKLPPIKALSITPEEREALPFVSNGLLFVICGESERCFNVSRIVQIIPMDDDLQAIIVYEMQTKDSPFITQIIHHRVADIREALS